MSIDLKTTSVEPIRRTFDHIARKLGPDKNPTRYQEANWGLQPTLNFHYKPTWDQQHDIYDPARTAIVMADFDDLVDPRQYYYGAWTIQRGKQQDSQEKNFAMVEKRGLLDGLDGAWRERLEAFVVPLRHAAWAANTNNSYISAYGFGAPVTSGCAMHMMDHLGVAQYISRIGLLLGGNEAGILDAGREAWIEAPHWQPMRKLAEDSMVTKDWFELFVLQNLLIDGLLQPLAFDRFANALVPHGGAAFSMLTEFMTEWQQEAKRWVDAVIKVAAKESDSNRAQIETWVAAWLPQVRSALEPLAEIAFDAGGAAHLAELEAELTARAGKVGISIGGAG